MIRAMAHVPAQKPGRSDQDLATPPEFIEAVVASLGKIGIDLAAHERNHKCSPWLGPHGYANDALAEDVVWDEIIDEHHLRGRTAWLNPPYGDLAPWAAKADLTGRAGNRLAMLVPASVGSTWFRTHIYQRAQVRLLYPRITFLNGSTGKPVCSPVTGKPTPYPKDLMLCVWNPPRLADGRADLRHFVTWHWPTGKLA